MAYLELIQLLLLIGSVGVMCGAIALFLMNKERIQNYVDGFDGTKLFWCYFVLLFFFLCGYMGYLVHWIAMGMKGDRFTDYVRFVFWSMVCCADDDFYTKIV